jgi:large subunit ribosomal protein L25
MVLVICAILGEPKEEDYMDKITVVLQKREVTGKTVKRLRAEGLLPAVIHDHGKESIVVMGDYAAMAKAYQQAGRHHPLQLEADGKHYMALIKQATFDPRKHVLTHVVFNAVEANEKVDAEIPVRMKLSDDNDSTPAERAGLVVLHQLDAVEVEALPNALPDTLEFDGEKLVAVGDQVTVADLILPKGVVVKTEAEHPLATVFEPSALQAANDAAGGTADEEADVPAEQGEAGAEASDKGSSAEAVSEKK